MMDGQLLGCYYSLPLTSLKSSMWSMISALLAAVQGFYSRALCRDHFWCHIFKLLLIDTKTLSQSDHAPSSVSPTSSCKQAAEQSLELILILLDGTFCSRRAVDTSDAKTSLLNEKPPVLWSRLNPDTVTWEWLCRDGSTSHAEHFSNARMKWTTPAALWNTCEQLNICSSQLSTVVKDGRHVFFSQVVQKWSQNISIVWDKIFY